MSVGGQPVEEVPVVQTERLELVGKTRDETRAYLETMPPEYRKEVSPEWLARLEASANIDPWVHGFAIRHRGSGVVIGTGGYTGPPDANGEVEIAYAIDEEHQGKGYATEAAGALVNFAYNHPAVRLVRAHTLPVANASTRVLTKCGFQKAGEIIDPNDGPVWRWVKPK
ncbi:MAG TPA: GNAT family N-acetyltransferase [Steroidobacteraceae bacterium]|nr:GNAT family N-acetyltransferase [Steroidobacteraceae bacterium]